MCLLVEVTLMLELLEVSLSVRLIGPDERVLLKKTVWTDLERICFILFFSRVLIFDSSFDFSDFKSPLDCLRDEM